MDLTGEAGRAPQKIGTPAADLLAGSDAALATVAALFERQRTGRGHQIDISLVESMTRFMAPRLTPYLGSGELPRRSGAKDSVLAIYQVFETADAPLTLGIGNDAIWRRFCRAIGEPRHGRGSPLCDQRRAAGGASGAGGADRGAAQVARPRALARAVRGERDPGRPDPAPRRGRGRPGFTRARPVLPYDAPRTAASCRRSTPASGWTARPTHRARRRPGSTSMAGSSCARCSARATRRSRGSRPRASWSRRRRLRTGPDGPRSRCLRDHRKRSAASRSSQSRRSRHRKRPSPRGAA